MPRLTLQVERLGALGEGVAFHQGRAVFIPGALPGETVEAEVAAQGRTLRGELHVVVSPSPHRRSPACPLAGTCGGCPWMHLDEAAQLEAKVGLVTAALEHLGGLARESYELLAPVPSPAALGYRRRATLHAPGVSLGFYGRRSHALVPVEACPALTPGLEELPGRLAASLKGLLKDVDEVELLEVAGQRSVAVHLQGEVRARHEAWARAAVAQGLVEGALLLPAEGKGPARRFGAVEPEEGGVLYRADAFAQANAAVNAELQATVVQLLGPARDEAVLELYAGNGNLTVPLAARAGSVLAVEVSAVSAGLARQAVERQGLKNVRLVQGDAAKVARGLVQEGERFGALVVDPPRTGAPGLEGWAAGLLVNRVVYVACDPSALARDARALVGAGYRPVALQVLDLFPQTHHVEAVMSFARRA